MKKTESIPVVVTGAAGRMGRALVAAVCEDERLQLVGATEAPGHPALGAEAGEVAGVKFRGVKITEGLSGLASPGTVVIDFTAPEATAAHARFCGREGAAMVIGTTGLSPEQKAVVQEAAKKVPCVLAPNMSVGVNLLFYLVEEAARITGPGFDIEVVEVHHRLKKDAPSGTALRLLEVAAEARGWKPREAGRFCREGMIGPRPQEEIGVQTVRAGDIVGEHLVMLAGPGERLELIHRAHTRATFAQGAVRAAVWVASQAPGLYDMQDVLGLKHG